MNRPAAAAPPFVLLLAALAPAVAGCEGAEPPAGDTGGVVAEPDDPPLPADVDPAAGAGPPGR